MTPVHYLAAVACMAVAGLFSALFKSLVQRILDSSANAGFSESGTHEWRTHDGGHVGRASSKDVYDHQHGRGAWHRGFEQLEASLQIAACVSSSVIPLFLARYLGLDTMSMGFIVTIATMSAIVSMCFAGFRGSTHIGVLAAIPILSAITAVSALRYT